MEVELRWSPLSGSLVLWEVYIHHTGFSRHMQTLAGNSVGHTHLPFFSQTELELGHFWSINHCPYVPRVHIIYVFKVVEGWVALA